MSGKRLVIPSVNRHLNKFLGAALTIFLAFLLACGTADNEIRMGTEGAYPPYNFINDSGDLDGFELELGNELCRRANLKCTWVTNDWDAIISNLLDEQYDTIMAGMTITADRDELIDFTHSYFPPSPSVYVAQSGAGNEVVNGTVAAQVATIQAGYLAESGATLLEVELAEDLAELVPAIATTMIAINALLNKASLFNKAPLPLLGQVAAEGAPFMRNPPPFLSGILL